MTTGWGKWVGGGYGDECVGGGVFFWGGVVGEGGGGWGVSISRMGG